jgi:hypothetical protein
LLANYSTATLQDDLLWKLTNAPGEIITSGKIENLTIANDGLMKAGVIEIPLEKIVAPADLKLDISLKSYGYSNRYPLWVYENPGPPRISTKVFIAYHYDESILERLSQGASVLLFPGPGDASMNSVGGLFPPEFWNYGMFKGISEWVKKPVSPGTLGILTDTRHPIFNSFPTDFHTNWQWFSIIKASHPFILDKLDKSYSPIVQVIDNLERNHKLGLIFEVAVGEGKLLVCASWINEILEIPEAYSFYNSILDYMESDEFNPAYKIDAAGLAELFQ